MQKSLRTILAWLTVFGWAGTLAAPAQAAPLSDALIEGAKLCTRHLPRYERENGIPTHLLAAIASTESGRYHRQLGIKVPWPWTINADGKSYYYHSKAEAIAAARHMKSRGVESMDVGCMQVNLHHHPDAFASLDQAFDPQTNIAYAAGFLKSLYDEEGSWRKAAADYHSRTPSLGREYVGEVYNSWYQIIEKLRAARLQVPASSVVAMNNLKTASPHVIHIASAAPVQTKGLPKGLPEQRGRAVAAHVTPHIRTIRVARADHQRLQRENGIIIVHSPAPAPAPMAVAVNNLDASLSPSAGGAYASEPMVEPAADDRAVHASERHSLILPAEDSKKTGPTFIFND